MFTKNISHRQRLLLLISFFLSSFAVLIPLLAHAQLVPCDAVGEQGCNACHFAELGNNVLVWLIGVLFMVFAVVIFVAGWNFVTSAGNPDAKNKAKSMFTNAFIGLIIVLAAWIIVDTVMRMLLNGGDLTQYSGFGLWSEVQCEFQPVPGLVLYSPESRTDDTAGMAAYDPAMLAALGDGEDGIVEFAQLMDSLNCAYNQSLRNACAGDPAYTDCSDLVNAAYQAAGCSSPGTYTGNMVTNARPYSDPSELRPGDALIHRTDGAGHVVICQDVGCNTVIHASGRRTGIIVSNGSTYYNDPRYQAGGAVRAADFCP